MKAVITGGCGFIGSNTALRLSQAGWDVLLYDNLARKGAAANLEWLRGQTAVRFLEADVRDGEELERVFAEERPAVAIHLAAQVAVTTSVDRPRHDFELNALGTFNVLEAIRQRSPETILLNASTNKVYGKLDLAGMTETSARYAWPGAVVETQPLDFHSPYGCSKGAADQYVIDYARVYGLKTVTFRQSCIYGPRQFGVEDQGWVAWFAIAHTLGRAVTLFGSGKQVRDLLHVDDLVNAYLAAIARIDTASGHAFNVGGGPGNTLSLLELIRLLGEFSGTPVAHDFGEERPGDQAVYVSDIGKAGRMLGWTPEVTVEVGVRRLWDWIQAHQELFGQAVAVTA